MISGVGDDDMVCGVKGYIADSELLCLPLGTMAMTGVFPASK